MKKGEDMDREEKLKWAQENLLTASEGMKVTEQSKSAFNNAVVDGYIPVFMKLNEKGGRPLNLYLKEDLELYKAGKREQRGKKKS